MKLPDLSPTLRIAIGVAGVIACALGFRACAPPAREEVRKEAVAELRQDVAATAQTTTATVRTVRKVETRPDGGRIETTTDERTDTDAHAATTAATTAREVVKELVIRDRRASWRVTASTGWQLAELRPRPDLFRAEASRRVAGPVWVGVWAGTDRAAGLSVAFEW